MAGGATASVHLADIAYSPHTVTIAVGDTVQWVNDDPIQHSVTADDGSFDSSPRCPTACLNQGATFSHTFTSAGTFSYHCRIHGSAMTGTVVVRAAVTTTASTRPSTTPTVVTTPPSASVPPTTGDVTTPATTSPSEPSAPGPVDAPPPTTTTPAAVAPTPVNAAATFTG